MLQTMRNAWKTEDIRRKILFTLFVILIYRLGNAVPVPYVNIDALSGYFNQMQNTIFGMLNVMSGGAFANATIFALSIQPYINASIIIQLLGIAFPKLGNLSKEGGEEGKKKIAAITRYTTVGIGLLQGFAYYMMIKGYGFLTTDGQSLWAAIVIILTFTSGSALIMWLGEQITEFGIGNGISIILFASIVSRFPTDVYNMINSAANGTTPVWVTALMLLGALAMIVLIVLINDSERRLPVQYAKRVVGRKMYGGQSTYLPMKANANGVLPLIFAMTLMQVPTMILQFFPGSGFATWWEKYMSSSAAVPVPYYLVYFVLIIAFGYFYSSITFNPVEMSKNLQQNGGFIPGIRPGKPTGEYLGKISNRLTLFGSLYLAIIAIIPTVILNSLHVTSMFGATSVLIMVSVAMETTEQLEAQMLMRHYKGFLN